MFYPSCMKPINVKGNLYPCGKCLLCRSKLRNEWVQRCEFELCDHSKSCFLTLTFAEENVKKYWHDEDINVLYDDVRHFFMRVRKNYGKFRYFGVFELGKKGNHPHFHFIIFGLDFSECGRSKKEIEDYLFEHEWKKLGWIAVDKCEEASIRYVCGYCTKKAYSKKNKWYMSQGLGKNFFAAQLDQIIERGGYTSLHGKKVRVPRYCHKMIKDKYDLSFYQLKKAEQDAIDDELHWRDSVAYYAYLDAFEEKARAKNQQTFLNLSRKIEMYDRKRD